MLAFDLVDTIDEMEGQDFLKVVGGAILGTILGAGAGIAVVAEDLEDRKPFHSSEDYRKEQEWSNSIAARQGVVDASKSMEGYLLSVKLIYALAAACVSQEEHEEALRLAKEKLDGIFAVWLPQEIKDEIKLFFEKAPTFYDVGLMISEALKLDEIDSTAFVDSAEAMMAHLDSIGAIDQDNIEDEWNAFKEGSIIPTSDIQGSEEAGAD